MELQGDDAVDLDDRRGLAWRFAASFRSSRAAVDAGGEKNYGRTTASRSRGGGEDGLACGARAEPPQAEALRKWLLGIARDLLDPDGPVISPWVPLPTRSVGTVPKTSLVGPASHRTAGWRFLYFIENVAKVRLVERWPLCLSQDTGTFLGGKLSHQDTIR